MSIGDIAVELYRCEKKVQELEKKLVQLGRQASSERVGLEAELFQAKKNGIISKPSWRLKRFALAHLRRTRFEFRVPS